LIIPYFKPRRHSVTFSLLLLLALLLLVLTGLGAFRLYFDFVWTGGDEQHGGQLFSLKIRGGNTFNLFDAEPFGPVFWGTQLITLALALLLPWFRLLGGSLLAASAASGIFLLYYKLGPSAARIPLEFEFLIVMLLYVIYVLLSYFAEVRDRQRFTRLLSQYVPPELASIYSQDPQSMGLAGEEREVSVLFCDVMGFSAVSEQLEPQQVAQWLNGFFTLVSRIVVRHRGTIDKYIGDSVMAVWGAPARSQTHAFDALSAALDIQEEIRELNQHYEDDGLPTIQVGVGVSTGLANVGTLGSQYRMDYTVVGDMVNVAQRLEAQTRKYHVPIIASDETVKALPDLLFRELDTITMKGRSQAVTMYQPLGDSKSTDAATQAHLAMHREAMEASKSGDWSRAKTLFTQLRDEWGPAATYDLYLRGIAQASQ